MTHKRVAELIKNLLDANRTDNLNTWFPRNTVAALTIAMNDEDQIDSLEERTAPNRGREGRGKKTRMKTVMTICPYCENEVARHLYFDERGLVETDIHCKCGYHYSDAYGRVEITTPEEAEQDD